MFIHESGHSELLEAFASSMIDHADRIPRSTTSPKRLTTKKHARSSKKSSGSVSPRSNRVFTPLQYKVLTECFKYQAYPSSTQYMNIAAFLDLTPANVRSWYQNTRTRGAKETDPTVVVNFDPKDVLDGTVRLAQTHEESGKTLESRSVQCSVLPQTVIDLFLTGALDVMLRGPGRARPSL
ncbi:Homeobox domain [Carpediemonas membranifera]|uniref:Homeobox domain n=1 Tax=Carpediemonas membranifera TaxID=201153 RepID=A0A8J6ATD0_9EUKA|nr:Homeobox domain [Carpediemonas membranifera]|eukprot:KAG9393613.1 Homeobox domain [Carpediemonas membranifera]